MIAWIIILNTTSICCVIDNSCGSTRVVNLCLSSLRHVNVVMSWCEKGAGRWCRWCHWANDWQWQIGKVRDTESLLKLEICSWRNWLWCDNLLEELNYETVRVTECCNYMKCWVVFDCPDLEGAGRWCRSREGAWQSGFSPGPLFKFKTNSPS